MKPAAAPDPAPLVAALVRMGLAAPHEQPRLTPLAGGVSSDIYRVDLPEHSFCVKRALARLKVSADWRAPVARNAYEVAWLRLAGEVVPGAAPRVMGEDAQGGCFAMQWLDPADHPVWKAELMAGRADPAFAAEVGRRLAAIHAATAGDEAVAARFASDAIFHAIRIAPYLLATAARHPDRAEALRRLAETTARTRCALVHGDVSPKNILVGPAGPVFLDAECAWYGDPAFDPAFCLNHLLLKCLWRPAASRGYLACYDALAEAYLANASWEPAAGIEARAAALLAGLFLARVDGKSPAEYIVAERDRERVRRVARRYLDAPPRRLSELRRAWQEEIDP